MTKSNISMYDFCKRLFPLARSLTGEGVRETLSIIEEEVSELNTFEVETGTKCYDWTIPPEWSVGSAYIITPEGKKICDFSKNNLHLIGYSEPFNGVLDLSELQKHLHSLPDQPSAIPYITSYYSNRWGFCISENERRNLKPGKYTVNIDAKKFEGSMTYGEILLPGRTSKEILLSTYVCHPSMANNELSGIALATFCAKWLKQIDRYYSYRILFLPETIGSIFYISKNLKELKSKVVAGYVLTCIGDEGLHSLLESRDENSASNRVAKHVLKHRFEDFNIYPYTERGSDERQYCSPGVDLPIASLMRSKYWEFSQYHTSLDDLNFVTEIGLSGSLENLKYVLLAHESNHIYHSQFFCEPQLGKRGLYENISTKTSFRSSKLRLDLIAYCDGKHSLLDIAEKLSVPIWDLYEEVDTLLKHKIISHDAAK